MNKDRTKQPNADYMRDKYVIHISVSKKEANRLKSKATAKSRSLPGYILECVNKSSKLESMPQLEAIFKLYSILNIKDPDIFADYQRGYLMEQKARSSQRPVLWYYNRDERNKAIYLDTMQILTDEEIQTELI